MEAMQSLALLQQPGTKIPQAFVWPDQPNIPSNASSSSSSSEQLHRNTEEAAEEEKPENESIPVIDLRDVPTCANARSSVSRQIAAACERWGFFQVINHGVDCAVVSNMRQCARSLFGLPHDRKLLATRQPATGHSGYGTNVLGAEQAGSLTWSEAFTVTARPHHTADECALKLWPDDETARAQFCQVLDAYVEGMQSLYRLVGELLIDGLGASKEYFDKVFMSSPHETLRMNFYPVCPEPSRTIGLNTHTDTNCLALLHDGGMEGLQVLAPNGKWVAVRAQKDAFSINIGDMFQVLSNGRYKSVLHRAVVNDKQERLSLAFFISPPVAAQMVPAPELINKEHPPLYRPFTWQEYYCSRRLLCNTTSLEEWRLDYVRP